MSSVPPEKAKIYNRAYRDRQIKKWHAENGPTAPECACGCGETVSFNHNGRPNRFAGVNHQIGVVDLSTPMTEWHEKRREKQDAIPIEKFRAAVLQVKADRGFTWKQMAEAGGWGFGMLNYYSFDKRVKSVGRKLGEDFFKRIAGIPTEPSTHMKKKQKADLERTHHRERTLERMYGID